MALSSEKVRQIAHLARVKINEADIPEYAEQLSRILAFVEQLNEKDTSGIEPMSHPLDMCQRLRPDEVTEEDQRDHFQQVAPEVEDGHFLVPQVIE